MSMHNSLVLFLKSQLTRLDNNLDYKFIKDYTHIALHIGFALNMYISASLGKIYSKGRSRDFKGAELESHSNKARPSDI